MEITLNRAEAEYQAGLSSGFGQGRFQLSYYINKTNIQIRFISHPYYEYLKKKINNTKVGND